MSIFHKIALLAVAATLVLRQGTDAADTTGLRGRRNLWPSEPTETEIETFPPTPAPTAATTIPPRPASPTVSPTPAPSYTPEPSFPPTPNPIGTPVPTLAPNSFNCIDSADPFEFEGDSGYTCGDLPGSAGERRHQCVGSQGATSEADAARLRANCPSVCCFQCVADGAFPVCETPTTEAPSYVHTAASTSEFFSPTHTSEPTSSPTKHPTPEPTNSPIPAPTSAPEPTFFPKNILSWTQMATYNTAFDYSICNKLGSPQNQADLAASSPSIASIVAECSKRPSAP